MRYHMVVRVCELTGYGQLRYVWVSVPYVEQLVGEKYLLPENMPAPESRDLRRIRQSKAPPLRSLVRLARECESAEELGSRLKRRYQRLQRCRRGEPTRPPR
jgi:hypothetical protein